MRMEGQSSTFKKASLGPTDLFDLHFLYDAQLSPDGKSVVYVLESVDAVSERASTNLYLLDLGSLQSKPLTNGSYNNNAPRWSPDGRTIAFISDRTGVPQIYMLPVRGGESWPCTTLSQGVSSPPAWSPDGDRIAFTAGPAQPLVDTSQPYRVTRHLFRFDGIGLIENAYQQVYVMDQRTKSIEQLTTSASYKMNLIWSPNGEELLYQVGLKPDSFQYRTTLEVVTLNGVTQDLLGAWGWAVSAAWMPDGLAVCFAGRSRQFVNGSKYDLWLLDRDGASAPQLRTTALKTGVCGDVQTDISNLDMLSGRILIDPDGKAALVQHAEAGRVSILEVALQGPESWCIRVGGERACWPLAAHGGQILFAAADPSNPGDLYLVDRKEGEDHRLTWLNTKVLALWPEIRHEQLLFPSKDGTVIEGWAAMPVNRVGPSPTLVYIHGGPHYAFGYMYNYDVHMMVSQGYVVLMINHRASTGYGNHFATQTNGDWGRLDYEDIMAGVDCAIDRNIADPKRLGCFGLSFGGYMSCWIVGQTTRFRAAVPENPLTNWVSFYGVSNTEGPAFAVEELGGQPHEALATYVRCSPITHAHQCVTATLLIQGLEDHCCPPEQSEQFYTVLKANGCVVEMLRLPGSSHTGSINGPPSARRAQNEALLGWMDRHIKASRVSEDALNVHL